jgi:CCR4-NOT transcription complex subunit 4
VLPRYPQSEHVCPLCCEELDISDREFYPCKCGYQVCMWCWHRIRESETGLCPACRTPYGEDPHQFTALDVQEVLKANKEAQAVAKRERYNLQQSQNQMTSIVPSITVSTSTTNTVSTVASEPASAFSGNSVGDYDHFSTTTMEMPKDRTQLANMRVIRRNLIYAVGLPPAIAMEETLRRPEYFGQYGKIAKIVLNRSQTVAPEGGDPRRASASAYVTFQHKEDTLACILVLDGFYLDNRNIRASYGTSKYCSAFIKNVRCNNPECTYLHEMGATEDTFTKQEIQAGYVTSGRDVLARQQQILAEQLQQQQLSATGGTHLPPRKRIGGGGPSGTGKASAHPVFPPPEYDEPSRPPLPSPIVRAVTTQASSMSSTGQQIGLPTSSVPIGRAISVCAALTGKSPILLSTVPIRQPPPNTSGIVPPAATTTAASVVAGGRSLTKESSDSQQTHSTLTPLTPLKRTSIKAGVISKPVPVEEKAPTARNGKKQNGMRTSAAAGVIKAPAPTNTGSRSEGDATLVSLIGGDVIGPPLSTIGSNQLSAASLAELGGDPIEIPAVSLTPNRSQSSTLFGGDVFNGPLIGQTNGTSSSAVGGSSLLNGTPFLSTGVAPSSNPTQLGGTNSLFWSRDTAHAPPSSNGVIGSHISAKNASGASSALASILGINLPTGSGSLQESTSFWSSTPLAPGSTGMPAPSPLSALNRSVVQQPHVQHGAGASLVRTVGPPQLPSHNGGSVIGGVPIGSRNSTFMGSGPVGALAGDGNQSDIALLQSLLPGVHITTDNSSMGFGSTNVGWAGPPGHSQGTGIGNLGLGVGGSTLPPGGWVGGGGGSGARLQASTNGPSVDAIGQGHGQQNQNQGPGIW